MKTTQSTNNHLLNGVRLPAQDIICVRVNMFVKKHNHKAVTELTPPWRGAVVWCLCNKCGFTRQQAADLLGCSEPTARRDIALMDMLYFRGCNMATYIDSLFDYILYNAKYIP